MGLIDAAVKSQKSTGLIYITAEARNHARECSISEEMKTSNLKYLCAAVKQRSYVDTIDKLKN